MALKKLEIWSSDYCGHCSRVLKIVEDLGIPYRLYKIEDHSDAWVQVMKTWEVRTVPQIFVEEDPQERDSLKKLGGASDFYPLITSGDIWRILKEDSNDANGT